MFSTQSSFNPGPFGGKGDVSQVTAGPKTGFGLMSSDDGIAFYNKQQFTSVTPVWDFQNRMAADAQGQRRQALPVQCNLLRLGRVRPSPPFFVARAFRSYLATLTRSTPPSPRCPPKATASAWAIAGMIGMDQDAINQKVREGALPQFQQQIPQEALEEAQERIAGETAERNADLRAKGLIGNGTFAVQNTDFQITDLSLRSRPQGVLIGGR